MEDIENKIEEAKAVIKELKQERALAQSPVNETKEARARYFENVKNEMKQNRAVELGGTGTVTVRTDLVSALEDKTGLLARLSVQAGAPGTHTIPVWNGANVEFIPTGTDGTFAAKNGVLSSKDIEAKQFACLMQINDDVFELSAVDFEAKLYDILQKAMAKSILKQAFTGNGTGKQFTNIFTGATEVSATALNVSAIEKLALTVSAKTDNAVMLINPITFGNITAGSTKKDEILVKMLYDGNIHGVEIIKSPFVPAGKVIAGELGNYAVGVANDIKITPIMTAGSATRNYQAIVYMGGEAIVPADFFTLKISSSSSSGAGTGA